MLGRQMDVRGTRFTACTAVFGGAIHGQDLNTTEVYFDHCRSVAGAAYVWGKAQLTATHFTDCNSNHGGALMADGEITGTDLTITNCWAQYTGGFDLFAATGMLRKSSMRNCSSTRGT